MPGELIPIVMFISAAAVLIFRPITTRLGSMIDKNAAEKRGGDSPDFERMTGILEQMVDRLDRLEQRVDFTERMLESGSRERQRLSAALKGERGREETGQQRG